MGNSINSFDKFIIENKLKDVKALKKSVDKSIKKFVIESRKKFTLNPKIDREFTPYITLEKSIQVDDNYDELIDGIGDGISTTTYNYKRTYVPSDVYMKGLYTVLSDYMYKGVNGIFFYIINDITGQMCSVIDIEINEKGEISGLQKSHVNKKSPYTILAVSVNDSNGKWVDDKIVLVEDGINSIQISVYEKCSSDEFVYDRVLVLDKITNYIQSNTDKKVITFLPRCKLGTNRHFSGIDMGYCEIFGLYWLYASVCVKDMYNKELRNVLGNYGVGYGVGEDFMGVYVNISHYIDRLEDDVISHFDNTRDLHNYLLTVVYGLLADYSHETGIEYQGYVYEFFDNERWNNAKTYSSESISREDIKNMHVDDREYYLDFLYTGYEEGSSSFDSFLKLIRTDLNRTNDKSKPPGLLEVDVDFQFENCKISDVFITNE